MGNQGPDLSSIPADILERVMGHLCNGDERPSDFPGNSDVQSLANICKSVSRHYRSTIVRNIVVNAQLRCPETAIAQRSLLRGAIRRHPGATQITVVNYGLLEITDVPFEALEGSEGGLFTQVPSHDFARMVNIEGHCQSLCDVLLDDATGKYEDAKRITSLKFIISACDKHYDTFMDLEHSCSECISASPSQLGRLQKVGNVVRWRPDDLSQWLDRFHNISVLQSHSCTWDHQNMRSFFDILEFSQVALAHRLHTLIFRDYSFPPEHEMSQESILKQFRQCLGSLKTVKNLAIVVCARRFGPQALPLLNIIDNISGDNQNKVRQRMNQWEMAIRNVGFSGAWNISYQSWDYP